MTSYIFPFLAVIIGVVIALFTKTQNTAYTKLLLSFSGAFLLALTLFDLLPEVYRHLDAKQTGLYIMCGILLQIFLEFFYVHPPLLPLIRLRRPDARLVRFSAGRALPYVPLWLQKLHHLFRDFFIFNRHFGLGLLYLYSFSAGGLDRGNQDFFPAHIQPDVLKLCFPLTVCPISAPMRK